MKNKSDENNESCNLIIICMQIPRDNGMPHKMHTCGGASQCMHYARRFLHYPFWWIFLSVVWCVRVSSYRLCFVHRRSILSRRRISLSRSDRRVADPCCVGYARTHEIRAALILWWLLYKIYFEEVLVCWCAMRIYARCRVVVMEYSVWAIYTRDDLPDKRSAPPPILIIDGIGATQ
jgi:hypothetical protein